MARFLFPDEGQRLIYISGTRRGTALSSARGVEVVVWEESVGGDRASIIDLGGDTITDSLLAVDENSLLPSFRGPDEATTLYLSIGDSEERTAIYASVVDRLNQGDGGGGGGGGQTGSQRLTPAVSGTATLSTSTVSIVVLPEPAGAITLALPDPTASPPFVAIIEGDHLPAGDYTFNFAGMVHSILGQEWLDHPWHRYFTLSFVPYDAETWDLLVTPMDGTRLAGLDATQDFADQGDLPHWEAEEGRWGVRKPPRRGAATVQPAVESITIEGDEFDADVWDLSADRLHQTFFLLAPNTPKDRCVLRLPDSTDAQLDEEFSVVLLNCPDSYQLLLDFQPRGLVPYSFGLFSPLAGGGLMGRVLPVPSATYWNDDQQYDNWVVLPNDPSNPRRESMIAVPCDDTVTHVAVEGGRITDNVYVIQPYEAGLHALLGLPPARNHPGESVIILSADGAASSGVAEVDSTPVPGYMTTGDLAAALIASVGGEGTIDLTTATLGHPFVSSIVVDGVTYTTDPIDQSFILTAGDGYAGLSLLLGSLFPADALLVVDPPSNENGGVATSLTTGTASEVRFAEGQEEIEGVDLVTVTGPIPGAPGVIRTIDGHGGGLGFASVLPDYRILSGGGTHNHTDNARGAQRAIHCWAVPAELNGGVAKWSAEQFPLRDTDLEIGYGPTKDQDGNLIKWQNGLNKQLLGMVGRVSDGTYRLTLEVGNGEAQLIWVPEA